MALPNRMDLHRRASFLDRVATAPISWGICEVPDWGQQLPPERVLREMRELGFRATELGSPGFFPEAAPDLTALLQHHEMSMLGAFVPVVLHNEDERAKTRAEAEDAAALLAAVGAKYFVTAIVTSWDWGPRCEMTSGQWDLVAAGLLELEAICARHGLIQVIHPHVDTVVETAADVREVLDRSPVKWCFDTGHLFIGGVDPLTFLRDNFDRVGLVHLKDVDQSVVPALNRNEIDLMRAVQDGIFCNLGTGDVPIGDVVRGMEAGGFDGWYVVEQDAAITGDLPGDGEGPMQDVLRSMDYLRGVAADLPTA